jgi:hypothetical protein
MGLGYSSSIQALGWLGIVMAECTYDVRVLAVLENLIFHMSNAPVGTV